MRLASMRRFEEVKGFVEEIYAPAEEAQEKGTKVSKGHIKVIAQWYGHHEKVFRERAKQQRKRIDSWQT
jgi:hypothetical protein